MFSSNRKLSKFDELDEEECKSEDEMRRVVESEEELTDEQSSEEESKEISNREKLIRNKRNKGISVLKKKTNKNVCS